MPEELFLNCDSIMVDRGDHHECFHRGDSLEGVPAGTIDPLVRLGLAVVKSDMDIPPPEVPEAEEVEEVKPGPPNWMQSPIEILKLPKPVEKALAKTGIEIVGDIIRYGAEHGGSLTSIKGVGVACEKDIREALMAIQSQN